MKTVLKNKKLFVVGLFLFLALVLPTTTQAFRIVPEPTGVCVNPGPDATDPDCLERDYTLCDAVGMVTNIQEYAMQILAPIALLFTVVAGVMYLVGGLTPDTLGKAKKILTATYIGLVIVLVSWLVVNTIINNVLGMNKGDSWASIKCTEAGLEVPDWVE